jgi:Glycosyltransferases involved in cell wall biogenesis
MPLKRSIAIIARDEERYIGGCLASVVGLADEIVVLLDDRSVDQTGAVCQTYGARVIEFLQPGGSTSSRAAATAVELQFAL